LNIGIISTRKIYQSIEFQFYIVICLDRGTDLNRLLTSYWLLLRCKIKIWELCERCNMSKSGWRSWTLVLWWAPFYSLFEFLFCIEEKLHISYWCM